MIMNLPIDVSRTLITDFLFHKFVNTFKVMFRIRKWKCLHQPAYFGHDDLLYSDFYLGILMSLLPIHINKGSRIFLEQQEVDEMIFVCKGSYGIGFEINRKEKLVIKQSTATVIGGFECVYERRSLYLYKSLSTVEGYFIRKKDWKQIEMRYEDFTKEIKNQFLSNMFVRFQPILNKSKKAEIAKFRKRADHKSLSIVQPYDDNEILNIVL